MSPLNHNQLETIIKRITFARVELEDLKEFGVISYQTYCDDRPKRRNVERMIENLFNAASDIAKVIIAGENLPVPETYRETYIVLGQLGFISQEVASQMANFSRLRNVLAHQYLDIRWEVIEGFLKDGISTVESFLNSSEKVVKCN